MKYTINLYLESAYSQVVEAETPEEASRIARHLLDVVPDSEYIPVQTQEILIIDEKGDDVTL